MELNLRGVFGGSTSTSFYPMIHYLRMGLNKRFLKLGMHKILCIGYLKGFFFSNPVISLPHETNEALIILLLVC